MTFATRRPLRRSHFSVETLEIRALLASAGALDSSFGGGRGFVANAIATPSVVTLQNQETVSAVAVQSDGKIVVASLVNQNNGITSFVVERLDADGSLDSSFGTGGLVTNYVSFAGSGQIGALLLQPDGKIVEVGYSNQDFQSNGGHPSFVVIRLDADGTPDPTFGVNGVADNPYSVADSLEGNPSSITSAQLEPDGSILLAGGGLTASGQGAFFVSKLESNGQLDPTFGTNGTAIIPVAPAGGQAYVVGLALQANGQIVVAGNTVVFTMQEGAIDTADLIRLDADGTLDTSFGGGATGGMVTFASMFFSSLIEQPDGKFLMGGGDANLIRLDVDGSVDDTFGQDGMVSLPYETDGLDSIALQANGQIIVATNFIPLGTEGATDASIPHEFGSIRLNADGTLDTTYGNSSLPGLALDHFGVPYLAATPSVVAIDPTTGNIVEAGTAATFLVANGKLPAVAVARTLAAPSTGVGVTPPSPTMPDSFDGTDQTDLAVYEPISGEFAIRTKPASGQPDRFVPFGPLGTGQTIPAPADYQGDGQDQIAAYLPAYGVYAVRPDDGASDQYYSIGLEGAGQTIPAPADYFGTGQADVAVYVPSTATFEIVNPSNPSSVVSIPFGIAGVGQSIPAPADYFGTGQADLAVYLAQSGQFAIVDPANDQEYVFPYGAPGLGQTIPVPGDYDGAGHAEVAVYLPAAGAFIYTSKTGAQVVVPVGTPNSGEIPVPGDYDGSGMTEAAIYDPKGGFFEYQPAKGGPEVILPFGGIGNGAIPASPSPSIVVEADSLGGLTALAHAEIITPASTTPAPSTTEVVASNAAVPAGPMAALARVARTLVNQGIDDPLNSAD